MATKLSNLKHQLAHFRNVLPEILKKNNKLDLYTVNWLAKNNCIEVSSAIEMAIAHVGKKKVISEDFADLSDGSDVKMSTACKDGKVYIAPVTNIFNKTGKLRVQVYETLNECYYYFVIPYRYYKGYTVVKIPFSKEGKPKRSNKWWDFEVDSFKELSIS